MLGYLEPWWPAPASSQRGGMHGPATPKWLENELLWFLACAKLGHSIVHSMVDSWNSGIIVDSMHANPWWPAVQ